MKQLLFFDDFLVDRQDNLTRRWHEPRWLADKMFIDRDTTSGGNMPSVVPRPGGGHYLYYSAALKGGKPDDSIAVCLAESEDALTWRKAEFVPPRKEGFAQVVYPGCAVPNGAMVYFDPEDPEPARRYKMTEANRSGPLVCRLLYSPDGKDWTLDTEHPFLPRFSDTGLSLLRNPRTQRYQIVLRRCWVDRRIFLVESADLLTWSEPRLLLHPSPLDPPMTQLYGMPSFRYGDMFVGFLWVYQTTNRDTLWNKLEGIVTTELAYSYDGLAWNRTHRPFMPLREWGEYGGGCMYGGALTAVDGKLLVYATASRERHDKYLSVPGDPPKKGILPGVLRKDGFVSLAARSGRGELTTAPLFPRTPALSFNLKAPFGGVRAQICDPACRPLPGYTFADCEELRGDGAALTPRWREHADLSGVAALLDHKSVHAAKPGWFRLQLEMEQAELFSINGDFGVSMIAPSGEGFDYL